MQLQHKVAIVTGAATGIGKALALQMAGEGAAVAVDSIKGQPDKARQVISRIEQEGGKAIAIEADVTDEGQVKRLIEQTVQACCPTPGTAWDLVDFGGYAGGVAYALYRSADGGAHWQAVAKVMAPGNLSAPRGPGTAASALAAPSAQVAYLAGTCYACGGQGTTAVGETLDGGMHWRNLGVPGLPATSSTALSFPTEQSGWLVADWQTNPSQTHSAVFQTTDGGVIWQRRAPAPQGMVQVTFTLSLYGTVPAGQQFDIAGPRALGGGSGAIPICATIAVRVRLGLVSCEGNRTVYTRRILVPRGSTFHFYFERFTPRYTLSPQVFYSGSRTANRNLTIDAYYRFGT